MMPLEVLLYPSFTIPNKKTTMKETYQLYYQPKDGLTNGGYYNPIISKDREYVEGIARDCNKADHTRIWEARKDIKQ